MLVDGGNSPEVAGDEVAAQFGPACGVAAVYADAAATIHGIGFQIVVFESIVLNESLDSRALLRISITIVHHRVAPDDGIGVPYAQQVGDGNTARHRNASLNMVVLNHNSVAGNAGTQIDLRLVDIIQYIVIERAVSDYRSSRYIGGRADGCFPVLIKSTVFDDGIGVGVFDARFLKIAEHTLFKGNPALHHLDMVAILEKDICKAAVFGIVQ